MVKVSYLNDKPAKISKSGGAYKVLSSPDRAEGGLKILNPGTEKLVTDESKLCDLFLEKVKNKSTDLHKGTNINLAKIEKILRDNI